MKKCRISGSTTLLGGNISPCTPKCSKISPAAQKIDEIGGFIASKPSNIQKL